MAVEGLDIRDQGMALAVVQVFIDLSYIVGPVAYGYAVSSVGYSECYTVMAAVGLVALLVYLLPCSPSVRGRMAGKR
jgi:predicted MFS family arabinose efflux permease